MYGLSVIASIESVKPHKAEQASPAAMPETPVEKGSRATALKVGAIAALLLVLPALDAVA